MILDNHGKICFVEGSYQPLSFFFGVKEIEICLKIMTLLIIYVLEDIIVSRSMVKLSYNMFGAKMSTSLP